ncbi:MAG TPA: tetratricopeptide repeat protein [Kofleriaceae bacterium]|nr:tetratricopeptide repeat protein [Kofleriaceae bacterium]
MGFRERCSSMVPCLLALTACAGARPGGGAAAPTPPSRSRSARAPERTIDVEPLRVKVEQAPGGGGDVVIYDARELFDQANEALAGGSPDLALEVYARMRAEFPDSSLVPLAVFNSGIALEDKGDLAGAVARYREVATLSPGTRDALDGRIRAAAVETELGRTREALAALDQLLGDRLVTDADRIELQARRGFALLAEKRYAEAEKALAAAIALYKGGRAAHLSTDYYVAMAHYYLGEIPRRQFDEAPLRLPDEQLERDLEAKSSLMLLAKERFEDTIILANVYWATAAAYQIGAMQQEMWRALVAAPVPAQLTREEAGIYVAEVRNVARPYLDAALETHTKNVEIAIRHRIDTGWTEGSRQRIADLTELLAREGRGENPPPVVSPPAPARAGAPLGDPDRYVPARIPL